MFIDSFFVYSRYSVVGKVYNYYVLSVPGFSNHPFFCFRIWMCSLYGTIAYIYIYIIIYIAIACLASWSGRETVATTHYNTNTWVTMADGSSEVTWAVDWGVLLPAVMLLSPVPRVCDNQVSATENNPGLRSPRKFFYKRQLVLKCFTRPFIVVFRLRTVRGEQQVLRGIL